MTAVSGILMNCGKGDSSAKVSADPSMIGRWCYQRTNIPKYWSVLELHKSAIGYEMRDFANDGSHGIQELKRTGDIFAEVESNTGDGYQIDAKTGELNLVDNEGLIATTTKLSNIPHASDCQSP